MTPSDQQQKAIYSIADWYANERKPFFYLAGYAGTGKTTILPLILDKIGVRKGEILAGSYTGKAAMRMRQQGLNMAQTLHSMIYTPVEDLVEEIETEITRALIDKKDKSYIEKLRTKLIQYMNLSSSVIFGKKHIDGFEDYRLIIVDECSMVPEGVAADLLSFGIKILAIGDPGQLPPPKGAGFFSRKEPDFFLREVHRQAEESPIIQLATMARNNEKIPIGRYGDACEVRVSTPESWAEIYQNNAQVLVGTNRSRFSVTKRYRTLSGTIETTYPQSGEPLICLKNSRHPTRENNDLFNGLLATCVGTPEPPVNKSTTFRMNVATELGDTLAVTAHAGTFEEHITKRINGGFAGVEPTFKAKRRRDVDVFDFAYGITVHKAQGSEWNNVVVCNEADAFRENSEKWLYTAITRAKERLIILEKAA